MKNKRYRTRAHLALFVKDTPFRARVVKSRRGYQRRAKHRNQTDQG
jgi:stalled ribosome alternative rescue factor ArfA